MITKFIAILSISFNLYSCAQFEKIERSEVNKPAMSLTAGARIQAPASLTNLKSNSNIEVGSCTVCSH